MAEFDRPEDDVTLLHYEVLPEGITAEDPQAMAAAMLPDVPAQPLADEMAPATSLEIKSDNEPEASQLDLPTGDLTDSTTQAALVAMYGHEFPLLKENPTEDDWAEWGKGLWERHSSGVQSRLHLVERNRLFRDDLQWISSTGHGPWREPPKPRDAVRVVDNMIRPALDQRINLVVEQRPGFRAKPASQDPDDVKKAEAQQVALEYQWDQQDMGGKSGITEEAAYWPQTDGVSFLEVFWDPDAGPWHEHEEEQDGQGNVTLDAMQGPLGDVKTRVRRIEQVRVSAEATATRKPWYWVIRDTMPSAEAVIEYGAEVLENANTERSDDGRIAKAAPMVKGGYALPDIEELLQEQETVDRYTIYCDKSWALSGGLQMVVVGRKVIVPPMPLLFGVVPMVRWTDGSTDPAFYPRPIMEGWIDTQMRQNALWSKWIEGIRKLAGVNLLARKGAVSADSMVAGILNLWNVEGAFQLNDAVKELGAQSMSSDLKEALAANQKRFEDLSGWSDTSRGSFEGDPSGRSVLAQREVLERIFAPPIMAAAKAMTEWAKIVIHAMRWGYDIPRTVAVEGKGRPDLGRSLVSEDFDGVVDVFIDPETMMPMPRALRLFLLEDMMAKQLIGPEEYRRRLPFAFVQNLDTPDQDHHARARRIVELIKQTANPMPLPIRWVDDEAIHQSALEREIILNDDLDPLVIQAAEMRWMLLAQQATLKMGPMMLGAGVPGAPGGEGAPTDPATQPMLGTSPPVAAGALSTIGGANAGDAAAREFDARTAR